MFSSVIRMRTASLLAFTGIQTHKQMLSTPMTSVVRVQHQLLHCQAISRQVCVTTYKKTATSYYNYQNIVSFTPVVQMGLLKLTSAVAVTVGEGA